MWPLLIAGLGAAASAGGSYLAAKNKGKWEYDPYGQLSPEQRSVMQTMGPQINSRIAAGPQYYDKSLTAPWTGGEQDNLEMWRRLQKQGEASFTDLMSGKFPEDYFQKSIYQPMLKQYQQDVVPAIQEQFSGPGNTYYGGARANAVSKGYTDLYDTASALRAQLSKEARELPLQVMPAAESMIRSGAGFEAAPRLIDQYDLTAKYNEWTRGNNEYKSYLDTALNFLGVSSVSAQYQEPKPNPWAYALTAAGGMASSYGMPGMQPGSAQFTGGFDPTKLPAAGSAGYGAITNSVPRGVPGAMNIPQNFNFSNTMTPSAPSWMNQWDQYLESQKKALYPYGGR